MGVKMNDLANLMLFLASSKVQYSTYTNPDCIDEESVKLGLCFAFLLEIQLT